MSEVVSDLFINELNLLRNRLEAGESLYQCLATMGCPLHAPKSKKVKFLKLAELMLEGRTLASSAIKAFSDQVENEKKLLQLVQQKTLSPKIQAFVIATLSALLVLCSYYLFPDQLKPSKKILVISLFLCGASLFVIKLCLKKFEKNLRFLEWIFFLRSIQLSLKCGLSLTASVSENLASVHLDKLPSNFQQNIPSLDSVLHLEKTSLWFLAARIWNALLESHKKGLPLSEMLDRSICFQEEHYKSWIVLKSEKLCYVLLIPLFLLSLPSALLILLAPLMAALNQ